MLRLRLCQLTVCLVDSIILICFTRGGLLVVITLEQIEAIQVVCHGTVIEGCFRHRTSQAMTIARLIIVQRLRIIAVHALVSFVCRIIEDGLYPTCRCASSVDPAILHITITCISNTSGGE